jgi:flagellar motility protein MotE (MotC chaperone)
MKFRPRLLPVVIVAATSLLGVKVAGMWFTGTAADIHAVTAARAQTGAGASAPKPAPAPQNPPGAPSPAVSDPPPTPSPASAAAASDPTLMSPAEIDLLQQLSDRRAEIDKRAAALREQEVLLQATEQRIDEKIAKMQAIEQSIGEDVKKQDDREQERIKSLVRIYEQMKPKDAAPIFEQLDMPILVNVLEQMKERNASSILAAMDPAKAKAVTMVMADRRSQPPQSAVPASPPVPAATPPRPQSP